MILDKSHKELAVKIVYASEHAGALDEVDALAAQAKLGTASNIVSRLDGAVRTFELRVPALAVRGFPLQLKIVGISLDQLGIADAAGVEKTLFAADGGIVVAGPDAGRTAAAFARIRTLLEANAPDGASTPIALVAPEPIDGLGDVPIAPNGRAALQSLLKLMVPELTKKLDDA
ncbi:MAG TPA: hypothetical protein VGG74_23330 [Kofleriaceae bacterium]|jgi:hypothetical protein